MSKAIHAMQYLSDRDMAARFGTTRSTIWRWVGTNSLPKPIKLSTGCTRWKLADVEAWESERPRGHQ